MQGFRLGYALPAPQHPPVSVIELSKLGQSFRQSGRVDYFIDFLELIHAGPQGGRSPTEGPALGLCLFSSFMNCDAYPLRSRTPHHQHGCDCCEQEVFHSSTVSKSHFYSHITSCLYPEPSPIIVSSMTIPFQVFFRRLVKAAKPILITTHLFFTQHIIPSVLYLFTV